MTFKECIRCGKLTYDEWFSYDINFDGPYCEECWSKLPLKLQGEVL